MSAMPPATIGPYRIDSELGRGGMGVVYLATDSHLDRKVAIKALPAHLASDPDRLARFQREARTLASLSHPNIATVYGLESRGNEHYLVMEFIDGQSLADRLARAPLPVPEALATGAQVAAGVEAAHEAGIVHRDLKPANIMLTADGRVKVLDFGLARDAAPTRTMLARLADAVTATTPAPRSDITGAGIVLGTPGYMSPEQARGSALDRRSDIFAFGSILYECLSGKRAFDGQSAADITAALLDREPDYTALPSRTPPRVRDLIARCLEKDPRLRQRDIGDVRIELERAIAGREWSTTGYQAAAGPDRSARRWKRAGWALLLAGAAFGAGMLAWSWREGRRPSAAPAPATSMHLSINTPQKFTPGGGWGIGRPMLTPDGRALCYIASNPEQTTQPLRVFVRRLDEPEPFALPGTENARGAVLSPDGRQLFFISNATGGSEPPWLGRVALDGSTPAIRIAGVDADSAWTCDLVALPGNEVAYFALAQGKIRLVRQPLSGEVARITDIVPDTPYEGVLAGPVLPGGGAMLATAMHFSHPFALDIAVVDLASGRLTTLCPGAYPAWSESGHLLFTRDSSLLAAGFDPVARVLLAEPFAVLSGVRSFDANMGGAVSISANGTLAYIPGPVVGKSRRLVWITEANTIVPWSEDRFRADILFDVSPDGRRLAIGVFNREHMLEIWGAEVNRPPLRPLVRRKGYDLRFPVLSPDGSSIAFSEMVGTQETSICVAPFDRSEEPRTLITATPADYGLFPYLWLPDGSGIVIGKTSNPGVGLFVLPKDRSAESTDPLRPFVSGVDCAQPTLSPDGEVLAYVSSDTGEPQVYVCSTTSAGECGPPARASRAGGLAPAWSADGRSLSYWASDARDNMTVVVTRTPLSCGPPVKAALDRKARLELGVWAFVPVRAGLHPYLSIQEGEDEKPTDRFDLVFNFFDILRERAPRPSR